MAIAESACGFRGVVQERGVVNRKSSIRNRQLVDPTTRGLRLVNQTLGPEASEDLRKVDPTNRGLRLLPQAFLTVPFSRLRKVDPTNRGLRRNTKARKCGNTDRSEGLIREIGEDWGSLHPELEAPGYKERSPLRGLDSTRLDSLLSAGFALLAPSFQLGAALGMRLGAFGF